MTGGVRFALVFGLLRQIYDSPRNDETFTIRAIRRIYDFLPTPLIPLRKGGGKQMENPPQVANRRIQKEFFARFTRSKLQKYGLLRAFYKSPRNDGNFMI
ncbi:hypothetical protein ACWIUD_03680 [Helicobacter sp. 23-1044]